MSTDPRWTPETEELMARLLAVGAYDHTDAVERTTFHFGARTILGSLADAGLLVPPDADRVTEWGVSMGENHVSACGPGCRHEDGERSPDRMRQTFTTPWTEVETGSQS